MQGGVSEGVDGVHVCSMSDKHPDNFLPAVNSGKMKSCRLGLNANTGRGQRKKLVTRSCSTYRWRPHVEGAPHIYRRIHFQQRREDCSLNLQVGRKSWEWLPQREPFAHLHVHELGVDMKVVVEGTLQ